MGKLKVSHKAYAAWDYEKELKELDQKSRDGWQLVKGGCFRSVFEHDDKVVYRYQLDYNTDIENRMRYIETFREQGWEYISSTFNGWHYFRKLYDPRIPEEEYEIYTDSSRISEMEQRWLKLSSILLAALTIMGIMMLVMSIRSPEWTRVPMILLYVDFIVYIGIGRRKLKRKSGYDSKVFSLSAMVYIAVACWIVGMILSMARPDCQGTFAGDGIVGMESEKFKVNYKDNYYLDLKIDSEAPVEFKIVDDGGNVVYSNTEMNVDEENIRLQLSRGEYQVRIEGTDGSVNGNIRVIYELG